MAHTHALNGKRNSIKADLGALGSKVDAIDTKFDAKFEALHSEFSALHSEFDSLRSEVRANQQALMAALQNAVLRGEMGTQREISELRERVTRIEDQLPPRPRRCWTTFVRCRPAERQVRRPRKTGRPAAMVLPEKIWPSTLRTG